MKKYIAIILTLCIGVLANAKPAIDTIIDDAFLKKIEEAVPAKLPAKVKGKLNILVYSKTNGFRHTDGIPGVIETCKAWERKFPRNFNFVFSSDVAAMAPEQLKKYDCIILNNSTGNFLGESNDVMKELTPAQKEAVNKRSNAYIDGLIAYVENGGGVFGIHAAIDSYYGRMDFSKMMGGRFMNHPWNKKCVVKIDDENSPITKGIWQGKAFYLADEMYQMSLNTYDRNNCRVLIRLDVDRSPVNANTTQKPREDKDVPLVLIREQGKGKVAYSAFGHTKANYANPQIQELCLRLLQYACGDLKADATSIPMEMSSFEPKE